MATIKGKWLFNETLIDLSEFGLIDLTQNIGFTSNNTQYSSMFIDEGMTVQYIGASTTGVYYNYDGWEVGEAYRTVDFGSTEQEVSDKFYAWFTANAIQQATLKGIWVFNKTIDLFDKGMQYVDFTSNGKACIGITCSGSGLIYYLEDAFFGEIFAYDGDWFNGEEYRTVDFGDTEQEVSDEFYTWFTSHAIHESNLSKVSGVWKFNETLVQSTFNCVWQDVTFKSNGVQYSSMVDDGGDNYNYIGYSLNTEENTKGSSGILWAYPGEWEDEAYRIVDFGSTEQIVESIFYTWFTANATQQATEEEEPAVLTKKFTRLYINEAVASSSGRVWKKLSAESAEEDSILGTWIVNENISGLGSTLHFDSNEIDATGYSYDGMLPIKSRISHIYLLHNNVSGADLNIMFTGGDFMPPETYYYPNNKISTYDGDANDYVFEKTSNEGKLLRTFTIHQLSTSISQTALELLTTWLKANATKQGATSLITFTIDGTEYQAEESMTWAEWCESDYNTVGLYVFGDAYVMPDASKTLVDDMGYAVSSSAEIIADEAYFITSGSGN